jgi:hypothetical protein
LICIELYFRVDDLFNGMYSALGVFRWGGAFSVLGISFRVRDLRGDRRDGMVEKILRWERYSGCV